MQEYSLRLQETLKKGLRPRDDIRGGFLTTCQAAKPWPYGLRSCADVTDPFGYDLFDFDVWPFPQLIRGKRQTFVITYTGVYTVTEESPNWIIHPVVAYNVDDESDAVTPTSTVAWHLADFFDTWFLFNGSSVVFKTNVNTITGATEKVYIKQNAGIQTGCAMPGRLVIGGFSPSVLFGEVWEGMFDYWLRSAPVAFSTDIVDTNTNFVLWTGIGGGDVLNMFKPRLAMTGVIRDADWSEDDSFIFEMMRRNDWGFMPMPWQGTVYAVKQLGKGFMSYGQDGIAYLPMVSEPYPTFGLIHHSSFGIASRGACGGNDKVQIFVTPEGELFRVSANAAIERLGYKEFLAPMLTDEIVITMNEETGEFYISSHDYSYVLTESGLGQCPQHITGACNAGGRLVGLFEQDTSTESIVVFDTTDLGDRDMKTVTTVEVSGDFTTDTNVYVAVDYRYNKTLPWVRSSWVLCNPEGFARVQVTAVEFRLCVKTSNYTDMKIDDIVLHYQAPGRRTVRGIYANQAQ